MSEETRTTSSTGGEKGVKPEVFSQFPVESLMQVARVYGFGANKYEAHNFRRGYEWSKSFDAMMRHAFAFWGGEDNDPESGLPHMAHCAWHAHTLLSFMAEHPSFDDRYRPPTADVSATDEPSYPPPPMTLEEAMCDSEDMCLACLEEYGPNPEEGFICVGFEADVPTRCTDESPCELCEESFDYVDFPIDFGFGVIK